MNILEQFGLNNEQALLLFSLQRYLVSEDIKAEKNMSIQKKKKTWLSNWEKGIENLLNESGNPASLIKDETELENKSWEIARKCKNLKTPVYLILLELSLFEPYYPIGDLKWKFYERVSFSANNAEVQLKKIANYLEIDNEFISRYKKSFRKSVRSLSNFTQKILIGAGAGTLLLAITAGFAAPYIATLAAPATLSGAAAINAGLAAIGGGAIAAGGFGMAGGMAVIVGGGSIFGTMSGTALGAMLSRSSDFALLEGAKLEVVMREIILLSQKDIRFAQEMIKGQQSVIRKLESQLSELKFNESENKERIKNLSKSVEYLRNSLKNSQTAFEKFNNNGDRENG